MFSVIFFFIQNGILHESSLCTSMFFFYKKNDLKLLEFNYTTIHQSKRRKAKEKQKADPMPGD